MQHWWADSPNIPGYTAVASNFIDLHHLVLELYPYTVDWDWILSPDSKISFSPASEINETQDPTSSD